MFGVQGMLLPNRLRYAAYRHALFTVDTLSLSVNLTSSTCNSCWRVDLLALHVTLMFSQISYHVGVAWRTYRLVHLLDELGTVARAHTYTSLLRLGALPATVVFWAHTAAFRGLPSNASRVG